MTPLTTIWPVTAEAKTRKLRPAPGEPLLRARPTGAVRYVCPSCGSMEQVAKVNWRTGRRSCDQCKRWYSFGVAFWAAHDVGGATAAPWNCLYMGRLGTPTNNRVRPDGGQAWVGEIRGPLVWQCPCGARARRSVVKANGTLACPKCAQVWVVGLLVYSPPQGARVTVPTDWLLPGGWDEDSHEDNKAGARRAYRRRLGATGRVVETPDGAPPVEAAFRGAGRPVGGDGLLCGDDGR
jgi:hypothetical protein